MEEMRAAGVMKPGSPGYERWLHMMRRNRANRIRIRMDTIDEVEFLHSQGLTDVERVAAKFGLSPEALRRRLQRWNRQDLVIAMDSEDYNIVRYHRKDRKTQAA